MSWKSYTKLIFKCTISPPHRPTVKKKKREETRPDIAAILVSAARTAITKALYYLNLYEKHFSYIKDLAR